eukprot:TRINITY_DN392_c2_g1_i1.p1 TRINITY_DN392_c2_g1~~TRINITY_DN392_c2_g1_i1.p1  ORF type:complete len:268 (+),score=129.90 TRINITY_DN392_c2_g1_i1:62-865(+)
MNDLSLIEQAKKKASYCAVDDAFQQLIDTILQQNPNQNQNQNKIVFGVGSGTTIVYAAQRLSQRIKEFENQNNNNNNNNNFEFICIPTSFQSSQLILENKLKIGNLCENPIINVCFDGADEVDANLNCIKGGGGCHTQEKIVASCAQKLIIVADDRKDSNKLGEKWTTGIPIEVLPLAYVPICSKIEALGAKVTLRVSKTGKVGPVVTDNGNFILDANFGIIECDKVESINNQLLSIPGVVETGLFVKMASKVYFGMSDGSTKVRCI